MLSFPARPPSPWGLAFSLLVIVGPLLLVLAVSVSGAGPTGSMSPLLPMLALTALLAVVLGRVLRPMVYRIEGGVLTVPAFFMPVRVRLSAATAKAGPSIATIRLLGGALPGASYLGLFRGGGENFHVAATTMKEGWHIRGDRHVFVSPADDAAFAAALRAAGATLV